jgi:hypothetical protein
MRTRNEDVDEDADENTFAASMQRFWMNIPTHEADKLLATQGWSFEDYKLVKLDVPR